MKKIIWALMFLTAFVSISFAASLTNTTVNGTLNVTDGGGFTNGTYTLFTYGTLADNGMTIGTTPNSSFSYTIDTSTAGLVKLNGRERR